MKSFCKKKKKEFKTVLMTSFILLLAKTPKSMLLPSVIKTLTNNTEIINIINRLGHGVSYSILSEMHTENAFRIQKQQLDEIDIPEDNVKEKFTVYVADNIDENKETLTGIDS